MIGLTVFVALGSVLGLAIFGSDSRRQRVNENI
jgi:hypothetical protein